MMTRNEQTPKFRSHFAIINLESFNISRAKIKFQLFNPIFHSISDLVQKIGLKFNLLISSTISFQNKFYIYCF